LSKNAKLTYLAAKKDICNIEWTQLEPDSKGLWLTEGVDAQFSNFFPMGSKSAKATRLAEIGTLFKTYFLGVSTNRDPVVYSFDKQELLTNVKNFIDNYNAEVFHWVMEGKPENVDESVSYES
jgi:predicted helicase